MKFTATALCILLAGVGRSATLAYWRMGDDTSSLHGAPGNGLTLARNSGNPAVEDANLPYDGATTAFHGAGAAFDNPVPLTGASNTRAVMNYSTTHLRIGAYRYENVYNCMQGLIDEVRISDRILDVAELLISRPVHGSVVTVR